jgi:hypothetical protein
MTIEAGTHLTLQAMPNDIRQNTRRLAKTATLDGGSVIVDGGYSDSDRSLSFTAENVPQTDRETLWTLFKDESLLHLATPEGMFSGYLETVNIENATVALSFSVYQKLT